MESVLLRRLSVGAQLTTPHITIAQTEAEVEDWLAANIYSRVPEIEPDIESLEDYWHSLTRPLKIPLSWAEELKPRRRRRTWEKFVEAVEFIMDPSPGPVTKPSIHYRKRHVPTPSTIETLADVDPGVARSSSHGDNRESSESDLSRGDTSISLTSMAGSSDRSPGMRAWRNDRPPSQESQVDRRRHSNHNGIYRHERFHSSSRPPDFRYGPPSRNPGEPYTESRRSSRPSTPEASGRDRNYLPPVESERRKMYDKQPSDTSDVEGVSQNRPKGDQLARKRMQETSHRYNFLMYVGFDAEWPSRQPRYNHLYLSEKHSPPALLQIALPDKILLISLIQAMNHTRPQRQINWLAQKTQIRLWDILEARDRDNTYRILDWRRMPLLRDLLTNKQICKVGEALDNDRCGLKNSAGIDIRGVFDFRVDYDQRVQTLAQELFAFSMNKQKDDIQRLRKGDWHRPSQAMLDYAAVDALIPLLVHRKIFSPSGQTHSSPPHVQPRGNERSPPYPPSAVERLRRLNQEKLEAAMKEEQLYIEKRRARKARWRVTSNHDTSVLIEGCPHATPQRNAEYYLYSKGGIAGGENLPSEDDEVEEYNSRPPKTQRENLSHNTWDESPPPRDPWRLATPPPKTRSDWSYRRRSNEYEHDSQQNSDSSSPVIQKRVRE